MCGQFHYTVECCLPQQKRRYGYFSLPIMHHEALVGQLDANAQRALGVFEVRNVVLEPGIAITAEVSRERAQNPAGARAAQ